jgi:UDP-N-acetylglucosamine--N-acetylmuramyl-(pentapeptide) pyrophosphoryl-undecaprenol N-acetylglucosamine transferase
VLAAPLEDEAPRAPGLLPGAPARFLVAGGYTGGHIQCALAIAAALGRACPGALVTLAGARGGPEVPAARAAGYAIETAWIGALDRRRLTPNLRLLVQLVVSRREAAQALDRVRPEVVVGVGGFPSVPFVLEAQRRGLPTLLHEANAVPGVANRLLGRRARAVCLADAAAARRFPAGRTLVTGNPARPDLSRVPVAEARARLGLPAAGPVLLVTGGSLGSTVLNRWMRAAAAPLVAAGVAVVWQCGPAHEAALRAAGLAVSPVGLLGDMATAYGAADLVVAAAGALTLAELAALGQAAILVPAPDVTDDHQAANARALTGVPRLAPPEVEARLLPLVLELLGDPAQRRAIGAAFAAAAVPDAADRIAAEVLRLREGRR